MKIITYLIVIIVTLLNVKVNMKRLNTATAGNGIINLHKTHSYQNFRKSQKPIKLQSPKRNERDFIKKQLYLANRDIKYHVASGDKVNTLPKAKKYGYP